MFSKVRLLVRFLKLNDKEASVIKFLKCFSGEKIKQCCADYEEKKNKCIRKFFIV